MADVYFLGSDRLPHCDDYRNGSDHCSEEVYYSGEVIKFLVDAREFKNYTQGYYVDENNNSWCTGDYKLPGEPGYIEGMNPPVVYGTPKIIFTINSSSGSLLRYAELSEEFSNVPQGNLEYHYTIQGTDNGTISVGQNSYGSPSQIVASDPENRISYSVLCGGVSGGTQINGSPYQSDFNDSYLQSNNYGWDPINLPNVTNVKINTDSGSVAENQVRILLKRSTVADKVPLVSDLLLGELAANTTDGIVFLKKADDSIAKIKPLEPQDFDTLSSTISSDTNNLDLGIKALTRLSVSAPDLKISGFKSGKDGEIKMIYNSGSHTVKILNDSTSSDSGNRVAVYNSSDFDLPSGHGVTIVYDGTSSVWRLF